VVRAKRERRTQVKIEDGFKSITPHTDRENVTGKNWVEVLGHRAGRLRYSVELKKKSEPPAEVPAALKQDNLH
jgi:hypothetical protein